MQLCVSMWLTTPNFSMSDVIWLLLSFFFKGVWRCGLELLPDLGIVIYNDNN